MKWQNDVKPKRPDRYLDWSLTAEGTIQLSDAASAIGDNRLSTIATVLPGSDPKDGWAKAQLRILGEGEAFLNNLIFFSKVALDKETIPNFDPIMTIPERDRLLGLVNSIEPDSENGDPGGTPRRMIDDGLDPALHNVYLRESQIYGDGDYRKIVLPGEPEVEFLEILHAGRPINELREAKGIRRDKEGFESPRVAIGIIDDGIAFAHDNVRDRIKRLWLQDVENLDGALAARRVGNEIARIEYGTLLAGDELEAIMGTLNEGGLTPPPEDIDIYRHEAVGQLDFGSSRHPSVAFRLAHGTHVMDLAAGSGVDDDVDRSNAPILAVQLPPAVTEDTSGVSLAHYVNDAVVQIMGWAEELDPEIPLVINFSYGFAAGPKDGSLWLEREIDRLVNARNKRGAPTAVVLPAGNSFESRTVALIDIDDDKPRTIDWFVPPDDETSNFLEIWIDSKQGADGNSGYDETKPPLNVSLLIPGTDDTAEASLLTHNFGYVSLLMNDNRAVAGVYCDKIVRHDETTDTLVTRYRYFIALNRTKDLEGSVQTAPSGPWKVSLTRTEEFTEAMCARLYIQRDDTPLGYRRRGRQSFFDHETAHERDPETGEYTSLGSPIVDCPIVGEDTINAIGTGTDTVVVGATLNEAPLRPSEYTSSGPALTRQRPDLSAVADESAAFPGIYAAGSRAGSMVALRGTSVAAPQVTRWIANKMISEEWQYTAEELTKLSPRNTKPTPPQIVETLFKKELTNAQNIDTVGITPSDKRLGLGRITYADRLKKGATRSGGSRMRLQAE